jgi:hypothetical protein
MAKAGHKAKTYHLIGNGTYAVLLEQKRPDLYESLHKSGKFNENSIGDILETHGLTMVAHGNSLGAKRLVLEAFLLQAPEDSFGRCLAWTPPSLRLVGQATSTLQK